jgi:hypothetical protein
MFTPTYMTLFLNRIESSKVEQEISMSLEQGMHPVLLHDGRLATSANLVSATTVDVRHATPQILESFKDGQVKIIYACDRDDLGRPYIEKLIEMGLKYYPTLTATPIGYISGNSLAQETLTTEYTKQALNKYDKWDFGPWDFVNLIQAIETTSNISGIYVEVGCFRGSSAGAVLSYATKKGLSLNCFFLDVFEGFDYPEAHSSSDAIWDGTHSTEGYEAVKERIEAYVLHDPDISVNVLRSNIITDSLPPEITDGGIRVANLDVDMYEAVAAGLHKLAPHINHGGILICEDAGHTPLLIGARVALDQFMASELGNKFIRLDLQSGQSFLIRVR